MSSFKDLPLGYIISPELAFMDQDKVMVIMNWPVLTTVKELQ